MIKKQNSNKTSSNIILKLILRQPVSFLKVMGNKNHYTRVDFLEKYDKLQKDFRSETPLFDVQRIKFPLSTKGMKIVDANGKRVKLAGGNWSGGHAERHCVGGLQYRKLTDMAKQVRYSFDMNCIRLTFSLQMFYKNNVIDHELIKANPELHGKTAMQIFDYTIDVLTKTGLMVILNNHTSKSQWCCSPSDGDGLWYNQEYPEQKFFECLRQMTKRYKNNPRVIGMDLRNEIRRTGMTSPTWGSGDRKTDWKMAAQNIANQLQDIAPHWLMFVGGIDYQLDFTNVIDHPIKLKIPNKLVYTGHFYGFSWVFGMWDVRSEESFRQKLFNDELYVRGLDDGIPFLMGEFGNNCQDIPWNYLIRLFKQYDLDWCYWCLDGYKCQDRQDQTYGIWTKYFDNVRHPEMLKDIKRVGRPTSGISLLEKK